MRKLVFILLVIAVLSLDPHVPDWAVNYDGEIDFLGFEHHFVDYIGKTTIHCVSKGDINTVTESNPALYFSAGLPSWKLFKSHMIRYNALGSYVFSCSGKGSGQSAMATHAYEGAFLPQPPERNFNLSESATAEISYAIQYVLGTEKKFVALMNGPGANFQLAAVHKLRSQLVGVVYSNMPVGPYHPTRHVPDKGMRENKEVFLAYGYKYTTVVSPMQLCLEAYMASGYYNVMQLFTDPMIKLQALDICAEFSYQPFPQAVHAMAGATLHHGFHWWNFENRFFPDLVNDGIPIMVMAGSENSQFPADIYDGSWKCDYDLAQTCYPVTSGGKSVHDIIPGVFFEVVQNGKMWSPFEFFDDYVGKVDRFLSAINGGPAYVAGQDWAVCMAQGYYWNVGGDWCNAAGEKCTCDSHMTSTCVVDAGCVGHTGRVERSMMMTQTIMAYDSGYALQNFVQQMTGMYYFAPHPQFGNKQELFDAGYTGDGFNLNQLEILWKNLV